MATEIQTIKASQLEELTEVTDLNYVVVTDGATSKKVKATNLKGNSLTSTQEQQLSEAYEHSQTPHVSADDIPTNISDLTNDSGFITSSDLPTVPTKVSDLENDSNFVTNSKMLEAIANAQLGNGEDSDIDLSAYQPIEESTLTTTAKTIPTAINELKSSLDGITVPTKTSDLENDSNFVTSIPEEYITETELETKGYLTEHQSLTDYAKKIDIPDVSDFLTEVPAGYVTDTKLSTELYKKVDKEAGKGLSTNDLTNELVIKINSSATEAFVTNAIANAQLGNGEVDLSGYATIDALNLKADLTHTHDQYLTKVPDEYVTETELTAKGYLTEHQDISNLALRSEIPDVSSFITSDDLPTVPTKVSDLENDKNYISSIPSEYVTETELNAKGYLTSHQDISGLQAKTDNNLATISKEVVGAINEVKSSNDTKLNKTDVNKLNCVSIDNVSLKEYILTNFTGTEKTYYLIAKTTCTDLPKASNFFITVETPGLYTYKVTAKELNDSNGRYVCTYRTISSTWTAWEKVCTTKIADVAQTTITPLHSNITDGSVYYQVKNGICYVSLIALSIGTVESFTICEGLPKCASKPHHIVASSDATTILGLAYVSSEGALGINMKQSGVGYCELSYPVAES